MTLPRFAGGHESPHQADLEPTKALSDLSTWARCTIKNSENDSLLVIRQLDVGSLLPAALNLQSGLDSFFSNDVGREVTNECGWWSAEKLIAKPPRVASGNRVWRLRKHEPDEHFVPECKDFWALGAAA